MTYSRFTVLMAPRMRGVVRLAVTAFAGFASLQLPAISKTASGDKVAENGIYQCYPEPERGCAGIKKQTACLAHPRCQWAKDAAGRYCRPIACWI
jgi:hypothetical protein